MKSPRYSKEEDEILIRAREDGMSYAEIRSKYLPGRSEGAMQVHLSYLKQHDKVQPLPRKTWIDSTTHPQFIKHTEGAGFIRDESAPVLAWAGSTLVWVRWTRETTEYYETNCWHSVPDGEQVRVRHWISIPTPPDMVLS